MSDAWGVRTGLSLLCIPSGVIGGALLASGAAHIRGDIGRVMEELEEERAEAARVRDHDAEDHVLQVRNLDFSYGTVQVLFGVDLDVRRGEVLALLGTNGAGKSTLLRCICGLGRPDPGTVRLHGHTITYAEPEQRVRLGIVMMPGGNAPVGPAHRRGEPAARRVPAAQRRRRAPTPPRPGAGAVPRAARSPRPAGRHAVGRPEADGGAGQGDAARARGAAHRRAVARPVAHRRPAGAGEGRAAPRRGADHRDRRAERERRPVDRRPGGVHGEGPGALRRPGRPSCSSGATCCGPCSSAATDDPVGGDA